jgi:type III pantothenate kinase
MSKKELMAVDIGNSRVKIGRYLRNGISLGDVLPQPGQVIIENSLQFQQLDLGLREEPLEEGTEWLISSVNEENLSALSQWLCENRPRDSVRILSQRDIRMPVEVDEPEKVGLDRLCNALAATCLAKRNEPVLIVDLGSAATLDVVSGDGRFLGGAIMPGFRASAFSLQRISQGLPIVEADDLRFPAYPGRNTTAAIEAGLFWGMVGAIRQFLAFAQEGHEHALLLLTGGDAFPVLEALLNPNFSPQDDSVIAEATRVTDPSGVSCPPVANPQGAKPSVEPMPDNAFIPVSRFHEAICCPYLTLSGIALCSK